MKLTSQLIAIVLLASITCFGQKKTQEFHSSNSEFAAQSKKVDSLFIHLNRKNAPGVIVAVVKDGSVVFKKAYGMANLEYGIPIDSSTVFDVASIAKQFVGFAISMLVEQGKISLHDDIRKYIPEFPDFGHKITIDHLVHHTSGLRDWPDLLGMKCQLEDDPISFKEILSLTYSQKELNFTPGSKFNYCQSGYNVLVDLVERVTGKSFREWTDTNIFQPLNMNHTHFKDDNSEIFKNKANGYFLQDSIYHVNTNNLTAIGSSSLYTTMDDFIKWSINMQNPTAGSKNIINRMMQDTVIIREKVSYGIGIGLAINNGINVVFDRGGWVSFLASSIYCPDDKLSIITFSNDKDFIPEPFVREIAKIYLKDKFIETPEENKIDEETKEKKFTPNQLSGWYYSRDLGRFIEVKPNNDSLIIRPVWLDDALTYGNTSGNTYKTPNQSDIQMTFSDLKDGYAQKLTTIQNFETVWERKEKPNWPNVKLEDYTGTFYCEELTLTYKLTVIEGKLTVTQERAGNFSLTPYKKEQFLDLEHAPQIREVDFIRDSKNKIIGCKMSGIQIRNLHFKKVE